MTKMTNAMALNFVLTSYDIPTDVREKLEKMLAQVEKKNTSTGVRKPTANQVENEGYKGLILEALADGEPHSLTDIKDSHEELEALSGQRLSAIVTLLKHEGKVERIEVKRKAYFVKVA